MCLHATESEKRNAIRQGIVSNDGCMENCIKLRINAGDKNDSNTQDKAIADAYGNKFIIPLDLEILDSAALYYQAEASEIDCVMSLLSMITTELPNSEYHHQKFQMLSIRSQMYP